MLVDPGLLVEEVLPDHGIVLIRLYDRRLAQRIPVLCRRIKVKDKDALRIQIIVHKSEYCDKIFLLQEIIQRITHGENAGHCTVQLKFPHILLEIQNLMP